MKIAVLIGGILYDSQKSLLEGIMDYAKEEDMNVFVFTCGGDVYTMNDHNRGEFQIYNLPDLTAYDGVIVAPNTIQNESVVESLKKKLAGLSVPVISMDAKLGDFISFEVDNRKSMYDMTEHVISEHGRRKLLYVSGPEENLESTLRLQGFRECAAACGLAESDYTIYVGDFWVSSGKVAVEQYFERLGEAPDAVICANDYMAIGAADALQERDVCIPEQVIVTGYDNSTEARCHIPRITSIRKPLYEMGREVCRTLAGRQGDMTDRVFEVKYHLSESCGCSHRKLEDIRGLSYQLSKEKSNNVEWSKLINSMSADINERSTLSEFVDGLKPYVEQMNFPYFYLCLCGEELLMRQTVAQDGTYMIKEALTDYPDDIQVAIAYEQGDFFPPETIITKDLLPRRFMDNAHGVVSVVVPVHFQQYCMGYCVVGNSHFPMETVQFQTWVMNLGTGLENIRKQMLLQSMIRQLNKMWVADAMTGVLNRAGFYREAKKVLQFCRDNGRKVLLFFLDIDKLKTVNDNYGHEEGDFYIKTVAEVCERNCGEHGIVMRYGGDEFVILRDYGPQDDYKRFVDDIRQEIYRIRESHGKAYVMDASIGHYISGLDEDFSLEDLLKRADNEMYSTKWRKRNGDRE